MKKIMVLSILAVTLASCNSSSSEAAHLIYNGIKNTDSQSLSSDIVNSTAYKSIQSLSSYFKKEDIDQNFVLSPSSYLLAVSGLVSVSKGFENSTYGLSDNAIDDVQQLLNAWNFSYENENSGYNTVFKSAILHQQVGNKYEFDEKKRESVGENNMASMVSSIEDYQIDAQEFFKEKIDLSLQIPSIEIPSDGAVFTYGGIKMKDCVSVPLITNAKDFTLLDGSNISVDSYCFGSQDYPKNLMYYDGDGYQEFNIRINDTSMLIILPDDGVSLNSIDVSDAYLNYRNSAVTTNIMGNIPYFHAKTEGEVITNALTDKMTGKEKLYSELLKDDIHNDLQVNAVVQSSDFEFNKYGVSGESITFIESTGSGMPNKDPVKEINVDRPFYAISLKDDFPIFVSKVINPNLK